MITDIIIHDGGRKLSAMLHALTGPGQGEWQAVLTIIDPAGLPDPRWGSVVKLHGGKLFKLELNEHCPISDELLAEVAKIFPP